MVMLKLVSVSIIKHCISVAGMQTKVFAPKNVFTANLLARKNSVQQKKPFEPKFVAAAG